MGEVENRTGYKQCNNYEQLDLIIAINRDTQLNENGKNGT